MSLVVFIHIEPGAAEPHTWSLALVPPQESYKMECTFYYIYNNPGSPLVSRQAPSNLGSRMSPTAYSSVYKICNFPENEEDDVLRFLEEAVCEEEGSWDEMLMGRLIERGWISMSKALCFNDILWENPAKGTGEGDEGSEEESQSQSETDGQNSEDVENEVVRMLEATNANAQIIGEAPAPTPVTTDTTADSGEESWD
ncbi:uncharacterized protein BDV17DRAFT_293264 [Aspergillus undulatus]|uniref:uncharacterized protein n=1 Tax=Aspergillus undulatus TaxID=1810928 RepID=UPI003CCCB1AC